MENRNQSRNRILAIEQLESRDLLAVSPSLPSGLSIQQTEDPFAASVPTVFSQAADGAGNSFSTARDAGQLNRLQQFTDQVDQTDRRDFYRFELARNGNVTIDLQGLSADVDLYLFDERGQLVDFSYNGGSVSEAIEERLEAGTYYVLVAPYHNAASSYQLKLNAVLDPPRDPDNAGNTPRQARDVGLLRGSISFQDRVDRSDREDFYRFQLDQTGNVDIRLDRLQGDVDLYLFDANGQLLSTSFRAGSQSETISAQLSAGTYYVLVQPWGDAESTYRLSLSAASPASPTNPPPSTDLPQTPTDPPPAADPPQVPADPPSPVDPPQTPAAPPTNGTTPLPNVPNYGSGRDWNLNRINAPEVWARGYTGQGVVIAVIDTGVDRQQSDLGANVWQNQGEIPNDGIDNDGNGYVDDVYGWNFVDNNNNTNDTNGHGTHVAGTIAALRNAIGATGVAYGARIMPVRVLGNNGNGTMSAVANGIRYAVDNGANIINLSLGGSFSQIVASALDYARENGVFVVIASGNSSAPVPSYPARHSATRSNVISVGAQDRNDQRAYFSNRVGASGAAQVDAPGVSIYSTLPGNRYGTFSGTSMAAPHVAGLAALALSANPNLSPAQLRQIILDGANRSIADSDASGGVNAALTVALALNAISQGASSSTGQGATTTTILGNDILAALASLSAPNVSSTVNPVSMNSVGSDLTQHEAVIAQFATSAAGIDQVDPNTEFPDQSLAQQSSVDAARLAKIDFAVAFDEIDAALFGDELFLDSLAMPV